MPNLQSFVARAPTSFLKNGLTSLTMATPFWKRSWREDTDGGGSSQRPEFSSQSSPHAAQVSPGTGSMCSTTDASTKVGAGAPTGAVTTDTVSAGPMYSVMGPMRHVRRVRHYHVPVQRHAALLADASILEPKKPRAGTTVPVSSSRSLVVLVPHPTLRQPQPSKKYN